MVTIARHQLEHFRARVIQDCMAEATAAYWDRRAADLEAALPQLGDWPGMHEPLPYDDEAWLAGLSPAVSRQPSSPMQARLIRAQVAACRRHARLLRGQP